MDLQQGQVIVGVSNFIFFCGLLLKEPFLTLIQLNDIYSTDSSKMTLLTKESDPFTSYLHIVLKGSTNGGILAYTYVSTTSNKRHIDDSVAWGFPLLMITVENESQL